MCECSKKIKELEKKIDQLMRWGNQLSDIHCFCDQVTDIRGYRNLNCWPLISHRQKPEQDEDEA